MIKFYFVVALLLFFIWKQCQKKDGAHAMRAGWFAALLLCPAWQSMQVRSIYLDHRSIAAGAGILLMFLVPRKDGLNPLKRIVPMPTDFFMGALFLSILATLFIKEAPAPLTAVEFARIYVLPYLVGRIFIQRSRDIEDLAPVICRILTIVTVLGVLEALTRRNLVNELFQMRFGLLETGEGYRWGMKRAIGCVRHPIFNGLMLVMIMPWAVAVHHYWKRSENPKPLKRAPWMAAVSIFFSISRGPHAAGIATAGIVAFFRKPILRVPLTAAAMLLVVIGLSMQDQVMHLAGKLAGEKEIDDDSYVSIDGELYEYTGTKHRALLNFAYAEAIQRNDWWGYGAGLGNVPIPDDAKLRFSSIDNHYLMFFLQYGYSGYYLFHCLQACAILQFFCCAWNTRHGRSVLCAGLTGAFVGVGFLMKSVWFDTDYGSVWLFCAGLAGCLVNLQDDEAEYLDAAAANQQEVTTTVSRRNLVPSYTPLPNGDVVPTSVS